MTTTLAASPVVPPVSLLRRWRRRLLVVVVILAGLYLFREPVLRHSASLLIIDETCEACDYLLVLGGDRHYDRAADHFHSGNFSTVLFIEPRPSRLQRLEILPCFEVQTRRELTHREVPPKAVTIIRCTTYQGWYQIRRLGEWLTEHPDAQVLVLCDRFNSRKIRHIVDRILPVEESRRIHLSALPHRHYDETNWWHSKAGLLDFFHASTSLTYTWLKGEETEEWREWDPDQYEKELSNPS